MTFTAIDKWWWPYLFIILAGWLTTDGWRYLGVYFGGRISEKSDLMVLVRAVATAFVAAVIGNLIIFPSGELAATPMLLRLLAAGGGFLAFLRFGQRVLVGIVTAEFILGIGLFIQS